MMKTAKMHTVGHQLRGAHAAGHFSKGIPILKSMPKQNTGKSDKFSSFRPAAAVVKGTPGDTSSNEILPANLLSNMTTASWCRYHKRMFGVVPEVAWGNLTLRDQAKWIEYDCNELFATKRVSKPIAACPTENYNDTVTTNPKLPLIAIMAATTTRNIYEPSVKVLSLFQLLFASLRLSLDWGFQYMFVLGYDVGDKFYDSKAGLSKTKTWFDDNVAVPLKEKNIFIKLRTVRVDNKLRKPGPVFLEIARFAYDKGAQFLYRVNDDTEFRGRWPRLYANALLSLGPPYGAVGPHSIGSNNRILTHDFVHRMHMEVFDMKYYPVELPDWWMDDWITHVYGPLRTFHSKKVGVYHHTNVHGQRYKVDQSNSKSLLKLIKKGRLTIRHWMIKNKISQLSVIEFEHSMKAPILLGKRDLVALKLRDIPPLK
ncbi:unnamed protein product [Symbiodinium microadriaticum]|nr:unnamed protein product [Symbiodinium microadriaticum]